ncbi:MAG: alpha/beta hydrolase [Dehalococcoidia bacterium]
MAIRRALATLGLLAVPPAGVSYAFERVVRRNLFRTEPYDRGMPEATGVPFEQVRFWTADGHELEGWLFHGGDGPATVLFAHGTSYNATYYWADEDRARRFGEFLRGLGCRFFLFDYRGYGRHGGEASEQGTYLDAEGAVGYLHNRSDIDATRIVFYGFSMGSGVAVELALREPCAGLILRAPFTSIRDLIMERYPRLRGPMSFVPWLPLTRYDSAAKIRRVGVPLLVMHGDADESVPYRMGKRLHELATDPKTMVTFPNAGHQDVPLEIMLPAMRQFIERCAGALVRA